MSLEHVELRVAGELGEQSRRHEPGELEAWLALSNARRRARGLPERTMAELRTELGGDGPGR